MRMAENLKELQNLSETELKKRYDEVANNTSVGLNFYLAEIVRRQQKKTNPVDHRTNNNHVHSRCCFGYGCIRQIELQA